MHRIEGDGYVVNGGKKQFTGGDPLIPTPATQVTAEWATSVQEELCGVIEGRGLTLNTQATDTAYGQLYQAIFSQVPAWQAMTLQTPWSALSHTASYRFESNTKRVFLKGKLQATIAAEADFAFWNVPAEYQPQHEILLPCAAASGGATNTGVLRLALGATPHLELYSWGGFLPAGGSSYTLYLDGISWTID